MNQLQKLLALTSHQWYLLISAMIWLPYIRLSLNIFGFKKTYNKILDPYVTRNICVNPDQQQLNEAKTVSRMIDIATFHGIYRANCLPRSLLLMKELNKRNIPCQLMIGTNEQGDFEIKGFGAHAWIVSGSNVLNDHSDISTRFRAFPLPQGLLD